VVHRRVAIHRLERLGVDDIGNVYVPERGPRAVVDAPTRATVLWTSQHPVTPAHGTELVWITSQLVTSALVDHVADHYYYIAI
jgi:hypothetical protein